MRWVLSILLAMAAMSGMAHAQEPRGSSGFCLALDDQTKTYYYSDVFPADPGVPTAKYEDGYKKALAAKGITLPLNCLFTDQPERVATYIDGLRQQCSDCAVYDRRKFPWRPNSGDAQPAAAQIAAPLPQLESVILDGEANAFVQVHTRMFACGDEIRMSYSLRPVPERGIDAVPLRGTVTILGRAKRFDAGLARPLPGHRLGCEGAYRIASLSDYEDQLVSGTFSDGQVMYNRTQMIEQLLARILVFSLDHVPLQAVQHLPASPVQAAATGAPTTPAPLPEAETIGLNREVAARNAEIDARNAAVRDQYDRQQAAFEAAKAKYEAEVRAHEASVQAADAAKAAYERQLEEYRKQLQATPPPR